MWALIVLAFKFVVTVVIPKLAIGALIGGAIGGLTAAVTGGDIGKGMLYGAIGGAVTAGLSGIMTGAFSQAWTAMSTAADAAQAASTAAAGSSGMISGGGGEIAGMTDWSTVSYGTKTAATQSWGDKLAASFTSEEAVGKIAGGIVTGGGQALGAIGAAGTAADAMKDQSAAQKALQGQAADDAYRLQQLRGRQSLEDIGATGVERRETLGEEIEGQLSLARLPYEEEKERLATRSSNLGMLTMGG